MSSSVSFRDLSNDPNKKKKTKQSQAAKNSETHRTLSQIHFDTVLILLRLRTNSTEKSLFLLLILTFLMSITILNNYLGILQVQYPSIDTSTSAFQLMNSLKYLDIAELLSHSHQISAVVSIFAAIYVFLMVLLYIACLVDRYLYPKSKARKYFFGRWFVYLSSFFIQLLSFPFAVIFLSFLSCTKEILGSCSLSSSVSDQLAFAFSLAGLILLILCEWMIQLYFYNSKFFKKDATSIERDPVFLLEWSAYRLILAFFTAVKSANSYPYFLCFLLIQALAALIIFIRINFTLASFTFANSSINIAHCITFGFLSAQHLSLLLDEICRSAEIYSGDGEKFIFFMSLLCASFLASVSPIRDSQLRYVLLTPLDLMKCSSRQLIFKIALFQRLNSQTSSHPFSDSIFKGIANQHLETPCPHSNLTEICFCKQKVLYDPKKRRDTSLDKIFFTQNNSVFTKFMVKSWYETYLFSHPNDHLTYLAYAEFLYFKMKNVSLALKNLTILENRYLSPLNSYRLYRLKAIILKHNRKRNHDAYRVNQSDKDNRNKLEIEAVIVVEQKISQIQQGIQYIIKNNILFWAYLEKSQINLNQINNLAKFSLHQLNLLKNLWKESLYYIDYRKKWRFYYCWYYLYILNKKIKVSMIERFNGISNLNENDVFSEELLQDNIDDDVLSVHSNLKAEEMEKIYIKKVEMAFDKRSVVFHVNHEYKGKILSVSRAIYHTFGYTQLELAGQVNISKLMPRIYQNIHSTLMINFAQTGKTKTLYSQRRVFCLNKQGYVFSAWKFVKQYVTVSSKCEYVAMFRPISPPAGTKIFYIIMNEEWEVDSMSEALYEGLGISAMVYQSPMTKQLLNLLVISPKLLRFSKFAKFLTEQDYKSFQNRDTDKRRISSNQLGAGQQPGQKDLISRMNIIAKFKRDAFSQQISQDLSSARDSSGGGVLESDSILPFNSSPRPLLRNKQNYIPTTNQDVPQSLFSNQNINVLNTSSPINLTTVQPINLLSTHLFQESSPRNRLEVNGFVTSPNNKSNNNINNNNNTLLNKSPNELKPEQAVGPVRRGQKKRTIISSSIEDIELNPEIIPTVEAPVQTLPEDDLSKKLNKDQPKEQLSTDPSQNRRKSVLEIMEQLSMGQNNQFLQTNFIRDEILKKKQQTNQKKHSSGGGIESEFEEIISDDNNNTNKDSDYEAESNSGLGKEDGTEEEEADFEKLDNLEKGDQVGFRLRIPSNLNEMLLDYNQRISQIGRKQQSRVFEQSTFIPQKTSRNSRISANSTMKDTQNSQDQRDRIIYSIIRDSIIRYQQKRSAKEYTAICTATFKKIAKQKIIIMKLTKFDETLKKKNRHTRIEAKQANGPELDPKKQQSLTQGQMDYYLKQASQVEIGGSKMQHFVTMKSELSEARESIHTNTFIGGRFGAKNEPVPSETGEDLIVAKGIETNIAKLNGMGYQLKMIEDEHNNSNNNALNSERSLKTFHKDFVNRQGARNISLSQNDNIYIKEDNHKPNRQINTIVNMKIFVRLFFLFLIALNTFTFFYGPNYQFPLLLTQSNKVFEAKNVLLTELQAYSLVLDQIILNAGLYDHALDENPYWDQTNFQNLITNHFAAKCTYFYKVSSDSSYRRTFFDKSITPYYSFTKDTFTLAMIPSTITQEEYSIDSYDIFSKLIFSLQTIQQSSNTQILLDYHPVDFIRMNTFPNLYEGLSKAQTNLVSDLQSTADYLYNFIWIIIIVDSVFIVGSFLVLFRLIFVICNAFKSVIEVFPKISLRDIRKIKNYNILINLSFSYITEKDDLLSGTHPIYSLGIGSNTAGNGRNASDRDGTEKSNGVKKMNADCDLEEPNDGNENLGKKSKDIEEGGFLRDLRVRILSLFTIFVALVSLFTGVFLFLVLQGTTNLQLIFTSGNVFMDFFGDNLCMMIGIKEKSLAPAYYHSSYQASIQSIINKFLTTNMQPHMSSLSFMNFDDDFNLIFYGDPCTDLQSVFLSDSSTTEECDSIAQGSLSQGTASFDAFYKNAISSYVNSLNSDILDYDTIFDYNRGIYFVDLFQIYLIEVWSSNTQSYLNGQLSIVIAFVVIMLLVLILFYGIITERLLLGRFTSEYAYFRTIYNMYMPDIIILKEKRIKFWLVKHSVLNK